MLNKVRETDLELNIKISELQLEQLIKRIVREALDQCEDSIKKEKVVRYEDFSHNYLNNQFMGST